MFLFLLPIPMETIPQEIIRRVEDGDRRDQHDLYEEDVSIKMYLDV
jgi:hypothetical protein